MPDASNEATLETVILSTAELVQKMMLKYGISEETAFEIYKWEVSTFLTYGQHGQVAPTITGGTDDDTGSDGVTVEAVVSDDPGPAD